MSERSVTFIQYFGQTEHSLNKIQMSPFSPVAACVAWNSERTFGKNFRLTCAPNFYTHELKWGDHIFFNGKHTEIVVVITSMRIEDSYDSTEVKLIVAMQKLLKYFPRELFPCKGIRVRKWRSIIAKAYVPFVQLVYDVFEKYAH